MTNKDKSLQKESTSGAPVAAPETAVFATGPSLKVAPETDAPKPERKVRSSSRKAGSYTPLVLLVLDGWGIAPSEKGNAIALAKTPNMDRLMNEYPTAVLHASGEMVGLPPNDMGNSEVGHLNLGAGKIIYQHLPMINHAIGDGTFAKNKVLLDALAEVKKKDSKLHIVGLVSDGGVHASQEHLYELLRICRDNELQGRVNVHTILDGRDTGKNSALQFIAKLETKMLEYGIGRIATLAGRFFSMDRDNNWDRIEKSYNAMRHGRAASMTDSPLKALEQSYRNAIYDEEFEPTVVTDLDGVPIGTIEDGDVIVFFNYRADRARQLTKALALPGFSKFDLGQPLQNTIMVTMTEYEKNLPVRIAFEPDHIEMPVGKVVAEAGLSQLRIAETEKYAHVTFFYNGGSEEQYENEERVLIQSPRVKSYAETPEMSVVELSERLIQEVETNKYQFVCANIANADMVGHTGDMVAATKAVEAADVAIGRIADAVLGMGGTLVITADHGNTEDMFNEQTGDVVKEHSTNPVPIIMCNSLLKEQRESWPAVVEGDLSRVQPVGVLSDVAPTVLRLLGLDIPPEMTSRSLIR